MYLITNNKMEDLNKSYPTKLRFHCHFCAKEYKTQTRLEKHTILCEIIYKTNNNKINKKQSEEEDDELPSQRRLYQMLLELGQKYNRLEEKVDEMSKWVAKKKKKINILEWLNTNITPTTTFDKLHENVQITEEDIEHLFQNTFLDTLNMVFSRTIYNMEEQIKPIFAFQQKSGQFYIYEPQPQANNWSLLSREKLIQFLNRCHRKISKALSDWKKNNQDKIKNDDKYAMEYDKTMSKVMSLEFKQESTLNKTKSMLHNHLKVDIKAFVEYEFEF